MEAPFFIPDRACRNQKCPLGRSPNGRIKDSAGFGIFIRPFGGFSLCCPVGRPMQHQRSVFSQIVFREISYFSETIHTRHSYTKGETTFKRFITFGVIDQ